MELPDWLCQTWPPIRQVIRTDHCGFSSVRLQQLPQEEILFPMLDRFASVYPVAKRPPVASQWSMNYLSVLFPAVLAGILARNLEIRVWEGDVELLHDDARPVALKVMERLPSLSPDQMAGYWERVLNDHLEPLFAAISAWGGVSTKVLWGNVIAVWDGAFDRLRDALDPETFSTAHQWMETPVVADCRLKLRSLQRIVASPVPDICSNIPLRKHCCLHYLLHTPVVGKPEVLCEACPRLHRQPLAAQASYLRSIYHEHG